MSDLVTGIIPTYSAFPLEMSCLPTPDDHLCINPETESFKKIYINQYKLSQRISSDKGTKKLGL